LENDIRINKESLKEAKVKVEISSASLERNTAKLHMLEKQYVEYPDATPPKSLELAIVDAEDAVQHDTEELADRRIVMEEIRAAVEGTENELAIVIKKIQRLKSGYDVDRILGTSKRRGKDREDGRRKLETLEDDRQRRRSTALDASATSASARLARLEKTRMDVQHARAAGKSDQEIEKIKESL
jgi:hypothetical protein